MRRYRSRLRSVVWVIAWAVAPAAFAQESPYIYGIHDADPLPQTYLTHLTNAGVTGWVTATVAVGHNPADAGGADFRSIANQGHTVICRINNAYCDQGTIPLPADYAAFAQRCAKFVTASQGCTIWVIGNETNLASEWPPSNGHKAYVSPQSYAECFRLVYDAIKAVRPTHQVVTQALGPFGGPYGSGTTCGATHDGMPLTWVNYMNQMLTAIRSSTPGPYGTGPDGIALHVNSRGYRYEDIHSTARINAGGQSLYWSFYVYKDWINLGIPSSMYHLPLYITECNGIYYWKGGHPENLSAHYETGWMQEVYAEINRYNTQVAPIEGKPLIKCVNMYRWCSYCDDWNIDGSSNPYKAQILADLDTAAALKYKWDPPLAANFVAAPSTGPAPLVVQFANHSTGSVDSCLWSFGDGCTSADAQPAHTYLNPGSYSVSLAVTGPAGSDTTTQTNGISVADPARCITYVVSDFERSTAGDTAVFRLPRSSNTSGHLASSPNTATVTDEIPAFNGNKCCKVQWAFADTAPGRWLRLTTNGTATFPNPTVDLARPVRVRLRLDEGTFWLCVGIRETGLDVPVGTDGGTTGPIEWLGTTTVTSGAPQGVLVSAKPGVWQTFIFRNDPSNVAACTGDGILSAPHGKGVLEHLAFTAADKAGPFTVYLDAIDQPCPPRGDFDRDDDVDMDDFAHLQACLSGKAINQAGAACQDTKLDPDEDVDADDITLFKACMSGPSLTPPNECY